ncbi:MAG: hypothetical protein ACRED1_01515 [Limisphaerales bacterium]
MTTESAIRWLHHQARTCRDRDSSEAFCLLLPAMLRILELDPMEDVEAAAFRFEFKQRLHALPFQDQADRADKFGGASGRGPPGSPGRSGACPSPNFGMAYADDARI